LEPVTIEVQPPEPVVAPRTYPDTAIPALVSCLDELAQANVCYCVWKSNLHLAAALAGETDVDLLVDRRDACAFDEIVARHGLKPMQPRRNAAFPGMAHLLGFDAGSGRLFHLHVHYQLVMGEKHVKNHRLPAERSLLHGTRVLEGVPVPRPELELSVLAIRALLKYRARDVVKDLLGIRSPGLPLETREEIAWLRGQTTDEAIRTALRASGDVVPVDVIGELVETAARRPRDGYVLFRLRARLRRALRVCRRRGRLRAGASYVTMTWRRRDQGMTPASGGVAIAFVGADGAGKSTIANATARWLGWKLDTRVHYMGSKEPSRPTSWLYVAFRVLRRGHRTVSRRLGPASRSARRVAEGRDVALALHHLFVGRDRARRYRDAQHDVRSGRVVIFDRYPFGCLSRRPGHRLLDGPQISTTLGRSSSRITRRLAAREEMTYERFRLPDHVAVLDVDPAVAAARKPDHQPDVIRAKAHAVLELGRLAEANGAQVTWVDADRPLDAVLLDAKARLWDVV
jgi:thymidylate kinase